MAKLMALLLMSGAVECYRQCAKAEGGSQDHTAVDRLPACPGHTGCDAAGLHLPGADGAEPGLGLRLSRRCAHRFQQELCNVEPNNASCADGWMLDSIVRFTIGPRRRILSS